MMKKMARAAMLVLLFAGDSAVFAGQMELVGILGRKIVLVMGDGAPQVFGVGDAARDGVRAVEVGDGFAVIEVDGRRQTLRLGAGPVRASDSGGDATEVSLVADARGHYFAAGAINGASVRFLVDTGASMVSIGVSDAKRAGINYRQGQPGFSETASGLARVWKVRLESVRLGDITLRGVDGIVHENELPFVLLGMSFLKRMDMQREGDRLVLRKRF